MHLQCTLIASVKGWKKILNASIERDVPTKELHDMVQTSNTTSPLDPMHELKKSSTISKYAYNYKQSKFK
jgi:hypothetical protein